MNIWTMIFFTMGLIGFFAWAIVRGGAEFEREEEREIMSEVPREA